MSEGVPGTPLAASGTGTYIWAPQSFDGSLVVFTIGNEVRTMVPELVPALSPLGRGLLGFLLMAFAVRGLRHQGVSSVSRA